MAKAKRLEGTVEISGMKVILTLQWKNTSFEDINSQLQVFVNEIATEWGEYIQVIQPRVEPNGFGITLWTARIEISAGLKTLQMAREVLENAARFHTY